MERMRRKRQKSEDRKRTIEWRAWRKEVVDSLQLRILSVPELFDVFFLFLFEFYFIF